MIIGPCRVITGGPEPRVIEEGGVRIVGSHVAQVGPIGGLAASRRDETVWPARGRLLLPGLVDAHAHLARHLARGLGLTSPAEWERYDRALAPEDVHWAALAGLAEGIRHGVTTTCDLHRSGSCLDLSLSELTSAASKLGARLATAYAAAEEDAPAERRAAIEESAGLAKELRRERDGRLRALLGVRARTSAGLAALIDESRAAADGGPALHVELAVDATPGERWEVPAAAAAASLWAHAERAPRSLAQAFDGVEALGVAAVGSPPRDLDVAWGSDIGVLAPPLGEAAPDAFGRSRASAEAIYRRVFLNGPRWLARWFGEGLGTIEPGAPADLILVDYQPPTPLDTATLKAHLASGVARAHVSGAMVAGEIVMDNGALVTVDEAEVAARARECARRVWKRL